MLCKHVRVFGVLLLLLAAGRAAAAGLTGAALAREVSVQTYMLEVEISMSVYDETTDLYAKRAQTLLDEAAGPVGTAIAELTRKDAAAGAALAENWRVMRGSLQGGGEFGNGILRAGYDATAHGYFDDNSQKLHEALEKAWALSAPVSPVESRAYVLVARTVANYVQASASPFGSYTNSFNTEDEDVTKLVTRVDGALAELAGKHARDKDKTERIRRINAKWQFIRTTILKIGKQATPLIVYKHGGDIVRELKTFNE